MAAKIFEVNDVLPATTQLRISWISDITSSVSGVIRSDNSDRLLIEKSSSANIYITDSLTYNNIMIYNGGSTREFISPYTNYDGNHPFVVIDTSNWPINVRTISNVSDSLSMFRWEDLNAVPPGYTISFNSNGGSSISSINDATELPNPLPTTTKSGYKFVNWYYDSAFTQKANAGDTIESNVTLYAKWHNFGSLFTEIADAIRSKDGTSESIRDLDFGERVSALPSPKEEETKTVTPNFSSGNVDVIPTSGKVLSQVTINKDANLIEGNIKSGVTIFGEAGGLVEGKPIEVSTAIAMDNLLVSDNVGKVYKFTGTTDANYINGELYEVVSE
jgi:uncharacterized repeat protein (TIGR02543 family)